MVIVHLPSHIQSKKAVFTADKHAKNTDAVKAIAELAGEVVVVDELTLIREGPVRVKLNGRDISKLRGFVEIFINKVGV